jgi:hypothetical protein
LFAARAAHYSGPMRSWLLLLIASPLACGGAGNDDTGDSSSGATSTAPASTTIADETSSPTSTSDATSVGATSIDPTTSSTTVTTLETTTDETTTTTTGTDTTDPSSTTDDTTTGGVAPEPFVTYLGGGVFEHARDIAYDPAGNLYVAGGTASPEFPSTLGGPVGNVDIFVAKYDPTGALLWAHRFGGPNYDRAYAIEFAGDSVVLAGRAGTGLATTAGVLQPAFAGDMDAAQAYGQQDAFVARLDEDGDLVWLTYFGGPGRDFIRDIAVDGDGDLYVAASQVTRDHPHVGPGTFDTTRSGMDCVAAKLRGDGTAVLWAGYLGGSGDDCPEPAIRVDADETAVMVISTGAADLPDSPGAFQSAPAGGEDLFVARVAADGAALVFGTYFGGSSGEGLETHNLALGPDGRVYLGAVTTSNDLPTTAGAYQQQYGGTGGGGTGMNTNYPGDGFVAVLTADGADLDHCTYLGGSVGDAVEGIAVAADGRVFVSGGTFSGDFPTTADAYQGAHAGELDGLLAVLSPDLGALDYASLVGGGGWDVLRSVAVGPGLRISGVGESRSNDLNVTPNAADASFGGGNDFDALVAQLLPDLP